MTADAGFFLDKEKKLQVKKITKLLSNDTTDTPRFRNLIPKWEGAAKRNMPEGQVLLGVSHWYRNTCGQRNTAVGDDSIKWFSLAAEQNNAAGQYWLGYCLIFGGASEQNVEKGTTLLQKAAEQGHADAQFQLGIQYFNGNDFIAKDQAEAVKWFHKAAIQEHLRSYRWLGECYAYGFGANKDKVKAIEWLQRAHKQHDEIATGLLRQVNADNKPSISLAEHLNTAVSLEAQVSKAGFTETDGRIDVVWNNLNKFTQYGTFDLYNKYSKHKQHTENDPFDAAEKKAELRHY